MLRVSVEDRRLGGGDVTQRGIISLEDRRRNLVRRTHGGAHVAIEPLNCVDAQRARSDERRERRRKADEQAPADGAKPPTAERGTDSVEDRLLLAPDGAHAEATHGCTRPMNTDLPTASPWLSKRMSPVMPCMGAALVPTDATQSRMRRRSLPTTIAARPMSMAASYESAACDVGGWPNRRV